MGAVAAEYFCYLHHHFQECRMGMEGQVESNVSVAISAPDSTMPIEGIASLFMAKTLI